MTVRVVVADDQALVRDGLAMVLAADGDIDVVGEACDGVEAIELARSLEPDIVLMDVRMPRLDGVAALRRIISERPATRILVLTTYDIDEYVIEALRAGASGYLLKDTPRAALTAAVHAAVAGDLLLDPAVALRLVGSSQRAESPAELQHAVARLTAREWDVLEAVADGLSNSEIAERLVIAEPTVKTHVARLLDKLSARDRVQLVVMVHRFELSRP